MFATDGLIRCIPNPGLIVLFVTRECIDVGPVEVVHIQTRSERDIGERQMHEKARWSLPFAIHTRDDILKLGIIVDPLLIETLAGRLLIADVTIGNNNVRRFTGVAILNG